MLDPLADELDMADQHGATGVHALFVGHAHDPQPVIARAFADPDPPANTRRENFAPAAGNRVQPRLVQSANDLPHIHLKKSLELHKLRRRKRVDVNRREIRLDISQQVFVILDRQAIVHPPLHQNLRSADGHQLRNLFADLLESKRIRIGILMIAPESAERAFGGAHIGVVDIPVDDVGSIVLGVHPLRNRQRPLPQIVHRGIVIKLQCLGIA